jgi:hypothetical protein
MFSNDDAAPVTLLQNAVTGRQRNPEPADRRPTIAGRHSSGSSVFGGWGPRLG